MVFNAPFGMYPYGQYGFNNPYNPYGPQFSQEAESSHKSESSHGLASNAFIDNGKHGESVENKASDKSDLGLSIGIGACAAALATILVKHALKPRDISKFVTDAKTLAETKPTVKQIDPEVKAGVTNIIDGLTHKPEVKPAVESTVKNIAEAIEKEAKPVQAEVKQVQTEIPKATSGVKTLAQTVEDNVKNGTSILNKEPKEKEAGVLTRLKNKFFGKKEVKKVEITLKKPVIQEVKTDYLVSAPKVKTLTQTVEDNVKNDTSILLGKNGETVAKAVSEKSKSVDLKISKATQSVKTLAQTAEDNVNKGTSYFDKEAGPQKQGFFKKLKNREEEKMYQQVANDAIEYNKKAYPRPKTSHVTIEPQVEKQHTTPLAVKNGFSIQIPKMEKLKEIALSAKNSFLKLKELTAIEKPGPNGGKIKIYFKRNILGKKEVYREFRNQNGELIAKIDPKGKSLLVEDFEQKARFGK